jgi:hypothetical protein
MYLIADKPYLYKDKGKISGIDCPSSLNSFQVTSPKNPIVVCHQNFFFKAREWQLDRILYQFC